MIRGLRAVGLACGSLASGALGQSPGPASATVQASCSLLMPMAGARFCPQKWANRSYGTMQNVDEQLQSLLLARISEAFSFRHRTVGTVSTVSTRHLAARNLTS
jgi:hypothetical protein